MPKTPQFYIKIGLNEVEKKMLEELKEAGYRPPEFFRERLREFYVKRFPPYRQPTPKDDPLKNLSNEEYCTRVLGGKVEDNFCVIPRGSGFLKVELKAVKKEKPRALRED